jgi:type II secretory pathway pseudopilin PulG
MQEAAGHTLVELLFVAGLLLVCAAVSAPAVTAGLDRARARAAARFVAAQLSEARMEAIARSAAVAFRFRLDPAGVTVDVFADGNRNGVHAADIAAGVDWPVRPPARVEDLFPGVIIGVPAGVPDGAVVLAGELLTFTPAGTATPGTIHVLGRDGSRFAVRVLGTTGRVRVLRLEAATGKWVEILW